jgi:hypothetical protein
MLRVLAAPSARARGAGVSDRNIAAITDIAIKLLIFMELRDYLRIIINASLIAHVSLG